MRLKLLEFKQVKTPPFYAKALLILVAIFFAIPLKLSDFYIFDLMLVGYLFIHLKLLIRVSKFTVKTIYHMVLIFILPIILSLLSRSIIDSWTFLSQYLFVIIILPLFVDVIIRQGLFITFLRYCFFAMVFGGGMFFYSLLTQQPLYFKLFWFDKGQYALSGFTPNDMGHYMLFSFFAIEYAFKFNSKFNHFFLYALSTPVYFFTNSKTLLLQGGIYLYAFIRKLRFWVMYMMLSIISVLFLFAFSQQLIYSFFDKMSPGTINNEGRVDMFFSALNYLPYSIFHPAFGSNANIMIESGKIAVGVHNLLASLITNFGFIFFIIISVYIFIRIKNNLKTKKMSRIYLFIIITMFGLMLNPMMNAAVLWFPLYIYIYSIAFEDKLFKGR